MMNSETYIDVRTKKMTPERTKKFAEGSGVFQWDLISCVVSGKVQNVLLSGTILYWNCWKVSRLSILRRISRVS